MACAMHFHYDRLIGQMEAAHTVGVSAPGTDSGVLVTGMLPHDREPVRAAG